MALCQACTKAWGRAARVLNVSCTHDDDAPPAKGVRAFYTERHGFLADTAPRRERGDAMRLDLDAMDEEGRMAAAERRLAWKARRAGVNA